MIHLVKNMVLTSWPLLITKCVQNAFLFFSKYSVHHFGFWQMAHSLSRYEIRKKKVASENIPAVKVFFITFLLKAF